MIAHRSAHFRTQRSVRVYRGFKHQFVLLSLSDSLTGRFSGSEVPLSPALPVLLIYGSPKVFGLPHRLLLPPALRRVRGWAFSSHGIHLSLR
jgi:hypothetical protein